MGRIFLIAFFLALFGACSAPEPVRRINTPCGPQRPAVAKIDASGACLFWYYKDDPEGRNPCGTDNQWLPEGVSFE